MSRKNFAYLLFALLVLLPAQTSGFRTAVSLGSTPMMAAPHNSLRTLGDCALAYFAKVFVTYVQTI